MKTDWRKELDRKQARLDAEHRERKLLALTLGGFSALVLGIVVMIAVMSDAPLTGHRTTENRQLEQRLTPEEIAERIACTRICIR